MYGTIAKLKAKPGAVDELRKMTDGRKIPGYIASYAYQSDDNPNELWLVAIFKDKETYVANADSPEQDQYYQMMRQKLSADPEWHDGEIVFADNAT